MYLKKTYRKQSGRTYLVIAQKYRDPKTGISKDRNVKSLGYLDALEKEYDDPIAHFKEVALKMTEEETRKKRVTLEIDMGESLPADSGGARNLGYAVPLKVYHELGIHEFLKSKAQGENFEFKTNSIMIMLAVSRVLSPGSKKKAFEEKGRYFERFDFSIDDAYRSLSHFAGIAKEMQRHMHERAAAKYGSDTSVIYYDCTNYYFQIGQQDELRRRGKSKENRKKPIVQMGLAMDRDAVPLHYEIFPGNILDKETFRSVIGEVRRNYNTGRIIAVADMGVITGDNIYYLVGDKPEKPRNGYVFSFSIRGGTSKFQEYVLDGNGYADGKGNPATNESAFKIKSRVHYRDITVTMSSGKKKKKTVYEKQVVFWSEKYFSKARSERNEMLEKAKALIAAPAQYNKATSYGAAAYVSNLEFDKKTGEIIDKGQALVLDEKKAAEEEKYDGYYSIVTSELHMPDSEIIEIYRGLWEIEETFKITKGDLEARPVYVRRHDHIGAHFLICFVALVILRLIQKRTGKKYSASVIAECLNKIGCLNEQENIYLFGYRSETSDAIGEAFGLDFTRKRMRLAEIKQMIGDAKKVSASANSYKQ